MGNIFFIQFTIKNYSHVKDAIGLSINQWTTLNTDWQDSVLIVSSIVEKEIGLSMEGWIDRWMDERLVIANFL